MIGCILRLLYWWGSSFHVPTYNRVPCAVHVPVRTIEYPEGLYLLTMYGYILYLTVRTSCNGTYHRVQYSSTYILKIQYVQRFQFGKNRSFLVLHARQTFLIKSFPNFSLPVYFFLSKKTMSRFLP